MELIQERPLLVSDALIHAPLYHANTPVISRRRDGSLFHSDWAGLDPDRLMTFLSERVARWWLPDRIIFMSELPKTGTGKVMKAELRKRFAKPATAET